MNSCCVSIIGCSGGTVVFGFGCLEIDEQVEIHNLGVLAVLAKERLVLQNWQSCFHVGHWDAVGLKFETETNTSV